MVVVQLAALGHLAGGGHLPDLSVLITATAILAPAGIALARRQRGFLAILGVLALAQVLCHLLFGLAARGGGMAQHDMQMGPMAGMASTRMSVLHLAAAVLTAVVLTRGEAATFALARLWRRLVRRVRVLLLPTPAGPPRLPRPPILVAPPLQRLLVQHARRGPPVMSAF